MHYVLYLFLQNFDKTYSSKCTKFNDLKTCQAQIEPMRSKLKGHYLSYGVGCLKAGEK